MTALAADAPARRQRRAAQVIAYVLSRPSGRVGAALVAAHLLMALVSPLIAPYDVAAQSADSLQGISAAHWLGTDQLGRDVLSRTLVGSRVTLAITIPAAIIATLWGGALGIYLGLGSKLDEIVMRLVDAFIAIPSLLFLLLVVAVFQGTTAVIIPTFAFFYGLLVTHVARAGTRQLAAQDFVVAARLRGDHPLRIVFREILPNLADTIIVDGTLRLSWMIVAFCSLSFLGLGVQPPTPEWGQMIADARGYLTVAPLAAVPPCLAIVSLIVGLNLLSDAIGKALGIDTIRQRGA